MITLNYEKRVKVYILIRKSTTNKKESRGDPSWVSLQQVNMGGALSTKTAFFYCVSKIGLYSIALSFLCILKIKGVVDNG